MSEQAMSHLDEFALIGAYFKRANSLLDTAAQVDLGIGDDAALFRVRDGHQCVVSSDMLVEGRHFFADVAPDALGHKALAVNLSDLAAMGAQPIGFTLSIGLPSVNEAWLAGFTEGLFAMSERFQCPPIGGDTTRSPVLVLNVTVFGQVPTGQAITRSGARVGDGIYVTGELGAPAYALDGLREQAAQTAQILPMDLIDGALAQARLERPTPRVAFGQGLRGVASSMLDLSDGLAGDLRHILMASGVAARLDVDALPLHPVLRTVPKVQAWRYALSGGDEYELCFTAPKDVPAVQSALQSLAKTQGLRVTCIGEVLAAQGQTEPIVWQSQDEATLAEFLSGAPVSGFRHF